MFADSAPLLLLAGIAIGLMTGLVGTSGAFTIPLLILVFGSEHQLKAQGTAMLIAALPIWLLPSIPYLRTGAYDLRIALLLALGMVVGGYVGALWAQELPVYVLRRLFAVLLLAVAGRLMLPP
jgi:uncharacterized protein